MLTLRGIITLIVLIVLFALAVAFCFQLSVSR